MNGKHSDRDVSTLEFPRLSTVSSLPEVNSKSSSLILNLETSSFDMILELLWPLLLPKWCSKGGSFFFSQTPTFFYSFFTLKYTIDHAPNVYVCAPLIIHIRKMLQFGGVWSRININSSKSYGIWGINNRNFHGISKISGKFTFFLIV